MGEEPETRMKLKYLFNKFLFEREDKKGDTKMMIFLWSE